MLARPGFVPLARPAFYSFIFVVGAGRPQVSRSTTRNGASPSHAGRVRNRNGPFGTVV